MHSSEMSVRADRERSGRGEVNCVGTTKLSGPITEQLGNMDHAINVLGETVNSVLSVFMPFLGPQPPQDVSEKNAVPTSELSNIAEMLRVNTRRIKELTTELNSIIGRCQL